MTIGYGVPDPYMNGCWQGPFVPLPEIEARGDVPCGLGLWQVVLASPLLSFSLPGSMNSYEFIRHFCSIRFEAPLAPRRETHLMMMI